MDTPSHCLARRVGLTAIANAYIVFLKPIQISEDATHAPYVNTPVARDHTRLLSGDCFDEFETAWHRSSGKREFGGRKEHLVFFVGDASTSCATPPGGSNGCRCSHQNSFSFSRAYPSIQARGS
uniref:Uncharacterized protein n=1 Tax=Opuntia streptacantha TaxID=393608 RepID=A0A7C9DEI9_OPUST